MITTFFHAADGGFMEIQTSDAKDRTSAPSSAGETTGELPREEQQERSPIPSDDAFTALAKEFIFRTENIFEALHISISALAAEMEKTRDKLKGKIEPYIVDDRIQVPEDIRHLAELAAAIEDAEHAQNNRMAEILEKSIFIGIFSEFDAFMGNLIKLIYSRKPELYNGITREISLSELLQFGSIEAVKIDMLEREVDSFRRESYVEQFSMLENKFSIKTLKKFSQWKLFVEMCQRRNIFTHNDGMVSSQYLAICDREGYQFEMRPAIGERLELGPKYIYKTTYVLSLIAFMLVHTLWRKVLPNELESSTSGITSTVYDCLQRRRWGLAAQMGEFSLTEQMKRGANDLVVRIRQINLAIAYKQCKKNAKVEELLSSIDWSACSRDFKLARAVLQDDFSEAADWMRKIGKSGERVDQAAYHLWPLFHTFRKEPAFLEAYKDIYGCDFDPRKIDESSGGKIQQVVTDGGVIVEMPGSAASVDAHPGSTRRDDEKVTRIRARSRRARRSMPE